MKEIINSVSLFFGIVWRQYDALPDGTAIRFSIRQAFEMSVLVYRFRRVLHG